MKSVFILVLFLYTKTAFSQSANKIEVFKTKYYQISYPAHWKLNNEEGIVSISGGDGAITLSHYSETVVTDSMAIELMLGIHKINKKPKDFDIKTVNNVKQISIEYVDAGVKWLSRMYIKPASIFFVTINIEESKWEKANKEYKDVVSTIIY